jgi:hypothetical protein
VVVFLVVLALYGTARDWVLTMAIPGVIEFGRGPLPRMADFTAWFSSGGLGTAVQTTLRGNPRLDRLRPPLIGRAG